MKMRVQYRRLDDLVPYERNARTHSEAQVAKIAASIREFGWTNPVLIDADGTVIAGHGRLRAARLMGMEQVPVIELGHMTEAQRRAYVIADNQLALDAGWDEDLLKLELGDLREAGFDLTLTGLDPKLIDRLLRPALRDPDEVPELPKKAVTKPGQIWRLGDHRVICADSTQSMTYERLLDGAAVDAVWTDPPYNVAYGQKAAFVNRGDGGSRIERGILNDDLDDASFRQFLSDVFRPLFGTMKAGAAIYVAHSETERFNFSGAFLNAGFKLSGVLIWRKDSLVLGRSDYQWIHEPILYGWKPGGKHRWYGDRKQVTVQELVGGGRLAVHAGCGWPLHRAARRSSAGSRRRRPRRELRVDRTVRAAAQGQRRASDHEAG